MEHRIREAMSAEGAAPIGGEGKIVEADESLPWAPQSPNRNARVSQGSPIHKERQEWWNAKAPDRGID